MLKVSCQLVQMIRPRMTIHLATPHKSYCNGSVSRVDRSNGNPHLKEPNNHIVPVGEILTDYLKETKWQVKEFWGTPGSGGHQFYKVSLVDSRLLQLPPQHAVVKMENGHGSDLESERIFYDDLYIESDLDTKDWIKSHKLEYLPIPECVCTGMRKLHLGNSQQFIVLEQCGSNITELLKKSASGKFNTKTICYIALRMIEALECIHAIGSVHADINGSNIVTGYSPADKHKVYLIDYGRVFPFGTAKEDYCILRPEDARHHWGTIAYTSIDVHNGGDPTQRGDMEILGYNIMEWAGVKIPWLDYSDDEADKIAMEKNRFKSNLLDGAFSIKPIDGTIPEYILTYMCAVYQMEYLDKPDYEALKNIFRKTLDDNNLKDDKNDLDWIKATTA